MTHITQLYPPPTHQRPLLGAYLDHRIRDQIKENGKPFVYANFVTSLDGRIAIQDPDHPGMIIPKNVANKRDWRLYQELAIQADLIISSGRYLRDWAAGKAQEILQVDDPEFADLKEWRLSQGLSPHPDIAILSRSLDFPMPEVLTADGRKVVVFTNADPDPQRVREIELQAEQVIVAGEKGVSGQLLVNYLHEMGYHSIYSAAGPHVLHLLLVDEVLDRLYLTLAHRLIGGRSFSSILEGELLSPAVGMQLNSIYLDAIGLDGLGQLFILYDQAPAST